MDAQQTYEKVRNYLDDQVMHLPPAQYLEFLELLISDLEAREETTRAEMEDAS